jgi:hypothetical protein
MTFDYLRRFAFGVALCCMALGGCKSSQEPLAPVKGQVMYRGRPVPGGTIVFIPDASLATHGNLATAEIKSDGTFVLKTNDLPGAAAGHHKVTIACVLQDGTGSAPRSLLPARYRDPDLSGLNCVVVANKSNTIDFDLE